MLVLGLHTAYAAVDSFQDLNDIGGKTGLPSFAGRFDDRSSVDPGADLLTTLVFQAIDFIKLLLGTIAVIFVIISGVRLVTSGDKAEEVFQKEKQAMRMIIYGLVLVIIADDLVLKVFFGDYGECITSASNAKDCAKVGSSLVKGLYSLGLSLMATIAVFVIVLSAFQIITAFGKDEDMDKEKKRIGMAVIGLIIAGIGEFVVKGIVFPESGTKTIDIEQAKKLVLMVTNFVAAFIGAGAFIMFFYAGYLYVAAAGNEEQTGKAKKILLSAVIGILIALAAYGLVNTVTNIEAETDRVTLPQNIPGLPRSVTP